MMQVMAMMEEEWVKNPRELGLMALFYSAGFLALKYERRFDVASVSALLRDNTIAVFSSNIEVLWCVEANNNVNYLQRQVAIETKKRKASVQRYYEHILILCVLWYLQVC